ncbi:GSCOCG00007961001-RA-CDS, partial [Cotesia congregata]
PPPGTCLALSLEPTFGLALSLKSTLIVSIFLSPPPGLNKKHDIMIIILHLFVASTRHIFIIFSGNFRLGVAKVQLSVLNFYFTSSRS